MSAVIGYVCGGITVAYTSFTFLFNGDCWWRMLQNCIPIRSHSSHNSCTPFQSPPLTNSTCILTLYPWHLDHLDLLWWYGSNGEWSIEKEGFFFNLGCFASSKFQLRVISCAPLQEMLPLRAASSARSFNMINPSVLVKNVRVDGSEDSNMTLIIKFFYLW